MLVSDFDYELPKELIAQNPCDVRDECRLMVLHRTDGTIEHKHFYDILDYLKPGDCLVFNDSKVIPARIYGIKESTGAHIEFLLSKRLEGDTWECLVRPAKRLHPGDRVSFNDGKLVGEILEDGIGGTKKVLFNYEGIFLEVLEDIGSMPLPPYIEREADESDKEKYQNVYAKEPGSVACATAGLHWTDELIKKAEEKGVKTAYVTLHVGIGTFRPVQVDKIEDHHMHFEEYTVPKEAADTVNEARSKGGRIIAVGTTACRTMESSSTEDGKLIARSGSTGIFIYPGYKFKMVDALITNFHLPKSTLLMLISALYNREDILKAYKEAVDMKYRFFSYGDAMFIE